MSALLALLLLAAPEDKLRVALAREFAAAEKPALPPGVELLLGNPVCTSVAGDPCSVPLELVFARDADASAEKASARSQYRVPDTLY